MRRARAAVEAESPADAAPERDPPKGDSAQAGDETRKRAIARAVWTEIHWLMPRNRTVAVTVAGDAIAVEFGPAPPTAAHGRPRP